MKKRRRKTRRKNGRTEEIKFFRDFGSLTNDSVVADIYRKRLRSKKLVETKAKECITRKMTDEEYEKYFGNKKF